MKKYLHSPKPGFLYVRVRGKYLGRITAAAGTPEFDQQYWEILRGGRRHCATNWSVLIESYRSSDRWHELKPRTRKDYEKVLEYIGQKNGSKDATRARRSDFIAAMKANHHRVRFANYIPQVASVLIEHGIDLGWPFIGNPAKGIRKLKTPPGKRKEHKPWPDWAVESWRSEARPLPRLIFEIGVGTVQRPSDWLLFTWGDFDGDALAVRQGKSGKHLQLPCTAILKTALVEAKAKLPGEVHPSHRILVKVDGRPMDYHYMARVMRKERERLGLMAYDLHALRYRGVIELALAGCSDEEIASYSGHSSQSMIRKYAGEARQVVRARQARRKRD